VTSSVPATGMPLPFFSYGGTSLLFTLASMGIVLNVSKHAKTLR
jgi:cell division protein FtsW